MKTRAFTLIELSIVLVVIGLLIGGVIAAQSLIEAATSRGIIRESNEYITLVRVFKDKYGFYPGDFPFATRTWGIGTDGNGNGLIELTEGEHQQVWYHLKIANMLQGDFTGSNEPISKIITDVTVRSRFEAYSTTLYYILGNTKNSFEYIGPGSTNYISSSQAYGVDSKIDDGLANKGKMVTWRSGGINDCALQPDGVTNAIALYTSGNAIYNMKQSAKNCNRLYFYID